MTLVGTKLLSDVIKMKITADIEDIADGWGIKTIEIDFESLNTLFITIPYIEGKNLSQAFHPDFVKDLVSKGYSISMVYADKVKGLRMYGVMKKQI